MDIGSFQQICLPTRSASRTNPRRANFRITDRQGIEADLNLYNVTNNGTAQQFVNGNNAASGTFGQLQNVQLPRSGQLSVRYHF